MDIYRDIALFSYSENAFNVTDNQINPNTRKSRDNEMNSRILLKFSEHLEWNALLLAGILLYTGAAHPPELRLRRGASPRLH